MGRAQGLALAQPLSPYSELTSFSTYHTGLQSFLFRLPSSPLAWEDSAHVVRSGNFQMSWLSEASRVAKNVDACFSVPSAHLKQATRASEICSWSNGAGASRHSASFCLLYPKKCKCVLRCPLTFGQGQCLLESLASFGFFHLCVPLAVLFPHTRRQQKEL